jgi:hypothetical protein
LWDLKSMLQIVGQLPLKLVGLVPMEKILTCRLDHTRNQVACIKKVHIAPWDAGPDLWWWNTEEKAALFLEEWSQGNQSCSPKNTVVKNTERQVTCHETVYYVHSESSGCHSVEKLMVHPKPVKVVHGRAVYPTSPSPYVLFPVWRIASDTYGIGKYKQ